MAKSDDPYAQAGVDYTAIDPGKLLAQRAAASTASELGARGGAAGVTPRMTNPRNGARET